MLYFPGKRQQWCRHGSDLIVYRKQEVWNTAIDVRVRNELMLYLPLYFLAKFKTCCKLSDVIRIENFPEISAHLLHYIFN